MSCSATLLIPKSRSGDPWWVTRLPVYQAYTCIYVLVFLSMGKKRNFANPEEIYAVRLSGSECCIYSKMPYFKDLLFKIVGDGIFDLVI
jgi:hypothetical protein